MNSTLPHQKGVKPEPASIAQLTKLNQLVTEQKPTSEKMQEALRLVPDLFQAELKSVNRYDLCKLIKRPLPFKVCGEEAKLDIDYDRPWYPMLVHLHEQQIITRGQLDIFCDSIKKQERFASKSRPIGRRYSNFFVVGCCNETTLKSFDLQPANLIEFLHYPNDNYSRCRIDSTHSNAVAGKCGSGWFWYSLNEIGRVKSVFDAFPSDRSYNEIFRYGELKFPTLVRRISR